MQCMQCRRFSGMEYGSHGFARALQINISVLLLCDEFLIVALRCKGGPKNCPTAIADVVLLHMRAAESLPKSDRVGFDFSSVITQSKALLLKYCKPLLGVSFQTVPDRFAWLAGNVSKIRASKRSSICSESRETFANCYYKLV